MAEKKRKVSSIFVTMLVTILFLALLTFVVIRFLLPKYVALETEIFYYAFKIYPLIIGLVLIQVSYIISRRNIPENTDTDKLPPNAYDSPLFEAPKDDPTAIASYRKIDDFQKTNDDDEFPVEKPSVDEEGFHDFSASKPFEDNKELLEKIENLSNSIEKLEDGLPNTIIKTVRRNHIVEKQYDNPGFSSPYKEEYKHRAYLELISARELNYDVTFGSTTAPIQQINDLLGENGDCFEVENKCFFIYPFANIEETTEEFKKAGIQLETVSNEYNRNASLDSLLLQIDL